MTLDQLYQNLETNLGNDWNSMPDQNVKRQLHQLISNKSMGNLNTIQSNIRQKRIFLESIYHDFRNALRKVDFLLDSLQRDDQIVTQYGTYTVQQIRQSLHNENDARFSTRLFGHIPAASISIAAGGVLFGFTALLYEFCVCASIMSSANLLMAGIPAVVGGAIGFAGYAAFVARDEMHSRPEMINAAVNDIITALHRNNYVNPRDLMLDLVKINKLESAFLQMRVDLDDENAAAAQPPASRLG